MDIINNYAYMPTTAINNNITTTYNPNPFPPNYPGQLCNNNSSSRQAKPTCPNKPYEILSDDKSEVIGYFWYYGNSIDLVFEVEECEDDPAFTMETTLNYRTFKDIAHAAIFNATIFNFRGEPVLNFSNEPSAANKIMVEENILTLSITHELSLQLVKGTYKLELTISLEEDYNGTLFDSNLKFEVR